MGPADPWIDEGRVPQETIGQLEVAIGVGTQGLAAAVAGAPIPAASGATPTDAGPDGLVPDDLRAILDGLTAGVTVQDARGQLLYVNDDAARLSGFESAADMLAAGPEDFQRRFSIVDEAGDPVSFEALPGRRALAGEAPDPRIVGFRLAEGSERWSIVRARALELNDGRRVVINTFVDITPQIELERKLRTSERRTQELAEERQRAGELARMMADTVLRLDDADDVRAVAQAAAESAVPTLADWCAVDLFDAKGGLRRVGMAARDAELARVIEPLRDHPAIQGPTRASRRAAAEGAPVVVLDVAAWLAADPSPDADHHRILAEAELRNAIAQPLTARGSIIGAVVFATVGERVFDPAAITASAELASRVGVSIATRQAHEAEQRARHAAEELAERLDGLFRDAVRFKRLLDATGEAILMLDPDGRRIEEANRGAGEQLLRPATELIGTSFVSFLDSHGVAVFDRAMAELAEQPTTARTVELAIHRADGTRLPVEVRLELVSLGDAPQRILAIARDIRERTQVRERLRRLAESEHARAAELNAVIEALGEGVVVCDSTGRILLANPAAEETFPDVEERTYADILAQLDDPDDEAPILGRRGGPVELRVRDGDERWIEVSTWPVAAARDEPTGREDETIVLLRDVTEGRQRQAVRDTFIGVLSHELRTPVTTIYAGAKVLAREGELDEETRRDIFGDIVIESERLHRLVEDVVAMTRFGDERGDVGAEPVLLKRLLPAVIASEESRWPGVRFGLDIEPGLATVTADPTYVEQVVRNLLSNAAKYGGPGAGVDVLVSRVGREIAVRIRDDGPGFPPDEADRLFDLFFRSAATARAAAGAGIGLFVCARLIRAMGGRIWATNRDDRRGAEFGFALKVMDEG